MRKKLYEYNDAPSMFVPSNPALNEALQNQQVPDVNYDGVTIADMRNNPIFDRTVSGIDKIARVQSEQLKNVPEVEKLAKQMQELKDYQTGQGRKR